MAATASSAASSSPAVLGFILTPPNTSTSSNPPSSVTTITLRSNGSWTLSVIGKMAFAKRNGRPTIEVTYEEHSNEGTIERKKFPRDSLCDIDPLRVTKLQEDFVQHVDKKTDCSYTVTADKAHGIFRDVLNIGPESYDHLGRIKTEKVKEAGLSEPSEVLTI